MRSTNSEHIGPFGQFIDSDLVVLWKEASGCDCLLISSSFQRNACLEEVQSLA